MIAMQGLTFWRWVVSIKSAWTGNYRTSDSKAALLFNNNIIFFSRRAGSKYNADYKY